MKEAPITGTPPDHAPPPAHVRDAFGAGGLVGPLAGGRGTTWLAGETVLKPIDVPPAALAWERAALAGVPSSHVRLALPLRAHDGRLVVDGWTARPYLPGAHEPARWPEIIAVGRTFHATLAAVPRPAFLAERTDRWTVADRIAWDEAPIEPHLHLDAVRELAAARRPVAARPQLVHGDLTGNALFHPDLPPAVIDLSPYWRPPAFASAVVVADALAWEGAGLELLDEVADEPEFGQCLVRALLYRIVTDHLFAGDRQHNWLAPYRSAIHAALDLA